MGILKQKHCLEGRNTWKLSTDTILKPREEVNAERGGVLFVHLLDAMFAKLVVQCAPADAEEFCCTLTVVLGRGKCPNDHLSFDLV